MSDNVIEVKDMGFSFPGTWLFKEVNLSVEKGDFVAVVGPNGSGKSTFLRLLLRELKPTEGEIRLFGEPLDFFCDWRRIGYVPQNTSQQQKYFPATVEEVVSMGLLGRRCFALPWVAESEKQEIEKQLERVGMWERRDCLVGELSGGQRQRVFLARALAGHSELLILDEPASGIDADAKRGIYELLCALNKEEGVTIVMVSHDMELAAKSARKALCLEAGGVCYWGEASQIMEHRHKGGFYYAAGGLTGR